MNADDEDFLSFRVDIHEDLTGPDGVNSKPHFEITVLTGEEVDRIMQMLGPRYFIHQIIDFEKVPHRLTKDLKLVVDYDAL